MSHNICVSVSSSKTIVQNLWRDYHLESLLIFAGAFTRLDSARFAAGSSLILTTQSKRTLH